MTNDFVGRKLGKYELVEQLGQGGMAEVYKSFQSGVERYVAVKLLHRHLASSGDFIARFQREARAVGQLQHPHIIRVIDFDVADDLYYMVMEWVKGGTLQEYLKEKGPLPISEALAISEQLTDALVYAHGEGMIHRDIKPANVMFRDKSYTQAILTDFGIARLLHDQKMTMTGSMVGTPAYMSPEAIRGEQVDGRADIYSLGVVLYEMLTGKTPYTADTPYGVISKQLTDPLPSPREVRPDLPVAVEELLLKALEKEPDRRYPSAKAFWEAVKQAMGNGQGAGRNESVVGKDRAGTNRQPWLWLVLAGAGVLFIAALTVFLLSSVDGKPEISDIIPTLTVSTVGTLATSTTVVEPTETVEIAAITPTTEVVAMMTETVVPAVPPSPRGEFRFWGDLSPESAGRFSLNLFPVPLPPRETEYVLWLATENRQTVLNLGTLVVVDGSVSYQAELPEPALGIYNQVLVSIKSDRGEDGQIGDQMVFQGTMPASIFSPLENLFHPETGVLPNSRPQIDLAIQHGQLLQQSLDNNNWNEARRHAEHVVNILDGEEGQHFGDLDGDGQAQNPGDGVGVRHYLAQGDAQMQPLSVAIVENPLSQAVSQMETALERSQTVAESSIEMALKIFAADSIPEAQPIAQELNQMLPALLQGTDFDRNGQIDPLADEGGFLAAQMFGQQLHTIHLFADDDEGFDLPAVARTPGQVRFSDSETTQAGAFELYVAGVRAPHANQHYELWLQQEGSDLLNFGAILPTNGELIFKGTVEQNLLATTNGVIISIEPNLPEGDTTLGDLLYVGVLPDSVRTAVRRLIVTDPDFEKGYLLGAVEQAQIAIQHGGFLLEYLAADDLAEARRHAEHIINILDGADGAFFGDLNGDGQAQNPGDGVGVRGYGENGIREARLVGDLENAGIAPFHAGIILSSQQTVLSLVDNAINRAQQVLASDTNAEADPFADDLYILLNALLVGTDQNGDGVADPLRNEGGLLAAYSHALLMAEISLTPP